MWLLLINNCLSCQHTRIIAWIPKWSYPKIDTIHLILLAALNHRPRVFRIDRGVCIDFSGCFPALTSAPVARHIPAVVESGFVRNEAMESPIVKSGGSVMTNRMAYMAIAFAKLRKRMTMAMCVLNCSRQICGSCCP